MKIIKLKEKQVRAEVVGDEVKFKPKPKIDRAKIAGVQKNDNVLNVLIDVPTMLIKTYTKGFLADRFGGHPYVRIVYNDSRIEHFAFQHPCSLIDIQESMLGDQLAIFLRNWPDGLREIEFIVEDESND